jgi:Uma2 family endonuclease
MNAPHRFVPDPRVEAAIEYGLSLRLDGHWETNGQGQIIVNPPIALLHAKRADKLIAALRACLPQWQVWPEVGVHTSDGVKAPDIAVASPQFVEATDARGFLVRAPEICIEVMSPPNTWEEMRHKALLYIASGAQEVWICDEMGHLHCLDGNGPIASSQIAPGMPGKFD